MTIIAPVADESWTKWCEQLPANWTAMELRRVAEISASNVDKIPQEGEIAVRLCNYTDVYYNDVITPELEFMEATATTSEIARFRLRGGEVLLTKDSETAEDIAIPAYVMRGLEDVVCGYHLYLLRPHPETVDGRFLMRACSVSPVKDQFVTAANGITRFGLGQQDLGSSLVPVPPLDVQRDTAGFLDRETAKIDRLIEQKERLIELLEEKRAALITWAVTKGLDPDVKMKDSGVERLGEIPAHWDLVCLRWLGSFGNGSTPNRDVFKYWDEGSVPWLTSTKINDRVVTAAEEFLTLLAVQECHLPMVSRESVLVAITGEGQTRGRAALLRTKSTINQHLVYITPDEGRLSAEFLWRYLESQYLWLRHESSGGGSTRAAITLELLKNMMAVLPPVREQLRIAKHILEHEHRLQSLRASVERAVVLLREYRTALISAAVTGKIDVREYAA